VEKQRLYPILALFILIAGCLPPSRLPPKPVLIDQGEVIIYLQPLPQQAQRLRCVIAAMYAIRADGGQIPLATSFTELQGLELAGRQKLLATGILPPGSYTGISIRFNKALVLTEDGEMELFVPEEAVIAPRTFELERGRATALFLSFNAAGAITSGIKFTPSFSLASSERQLVNLIGYVSNSESNLISVFNKKTMLIVDCIATGWGPKGIAFDQRRTRAYVAVSKDNAVEAYNIFTGERIGRARLNLGDEPIDLALTRDGRTLVSVNHNSDSVSIIDAISLFEIRRIKVGEGPNSVVLDPSDFKAYIFNTVSSTISVVDLTQRTLTATISVEGAPLDGDFNRIGDRLFVINANTPDLTVVDPSRFVVTDRIYIGSGATSIQIDLRTGLVLAGLKFGGEITVVDPSSSMFIDSIGVGGKAAFMTIDRQENTLFVVLPDERLLQKVNLTSKKIMGQIDLGNGPYEVAVVGER
jgi:YVTN family beta-propeller protein